MAIAPHLQAEPGVAGLTKGADQQSIKLLQTDKVLG